MSGTKRAFLWLMAAFYVLAGTYHFLSPDFYAEMVPSYLPWPRALVYVSGASEVLLGLLLPWPALTPLAAWGTIALLCAVFPANLHMALHHVQPAHAPAWLHPTPLGLWLRLPLQAVLIAWAYVYTRPQPWSSAARSGPSMATSTSWSRSSSSPKHSHTGA